MHASDCAQHNMPAMPNEPCDCNDRYVSISDDGSWIVRSEFWDLNHEDQGNVIGDALRDARYVTLRHCLNLTEDGSGARKAISVLIDELHEPDDQ